MAHISLWTGHFDGNTVAGIQFVDSLTITGDPTITGIGAMPPHARPQFPVVLPEPPPPWRIMHYNHAGAIIYKAIVAVVCITECLCLLLPEASAIPTNLEPAKDGIVYQPKNKTEKCTGPGLPGPCQGFGDRYRYDQTINNCTVFIWGGCGGNLQNNFETYEQCMQQCTNETREYIRACT
ncbi:predicted protein [Culex quinquefasciatus]|uniref:Predicted protein n=1 Tax=Culex quinquefasciatus TaxID=7176 RepID=B0WJ94_CULQU|nr:predicted protein [Culex quinquefasciatus]|eukprot:XP_001848778.1 predicted protein [Culex quinquefasciatus]